jgi:hypothetical protein
LIGTLAPTSGVEHMYGLLSAILHYFITPIVLAIIITQVHYLLLEWTSLFSFASHSLRQLSQSGLPLACFTASTPLSQLPAPRRPSPPLPDSAENLSKWSHPHKTESRSFQRVSQCHKEGFNLATNRPMQEANS